MEQDIKYLVRFDDHGRVLYSTAPFVTSLDRIADVIPFFEHLEDLEHFDGQLIKAYEFDAHGIKYFVDFEFKKKTELPTEVYELEMVDRTKYYLFYQKERTSKNANRIENDYLQAKNERLQAKVNQLESFISDYLLKNILIPVHNLKSSLDIIDQKFEGSDLSNHSAISKIIALSKQEADNLKGILDQVNEYQKISHQSTFESTNHCDLQEIVQGALQRVEIPIHVSLSQTLTDKVSVYVYKYHFTKLFEQVLKYAISVTDTEGAVIHISDTFAADQNNISLLFSLSGLSDPAAVQKRLAYALQGVGGIDGAVEHVSLLTIRKLVQLYHGKISVTLDEHGICHLEFYFDGLLPQLRVVA